MLKDHSFQVGEYVKLRKTHPCGSDIWLVIRIGADFRIKCHGCGRSVMVPRTKFERSVKALVDKSTL